VDTSYAYAIDLLLMHHTADGHTVSGSVGFKETAAELRSEGYLQWSEAGLFFNHTERAIRKKTALPYRFETSGKINSSDDRYQNRDDPFTFF
jgi:hypothetical protein